MRVLVAEDDRTTRRLLEATLRGFSYDVEAVDDGWAAWEALQRPNAPSVAVLDWNMPGMDGPALCRKLRQRENGPYIYLLLVTARSSTENVVEGLDAGANDFLTKPFNPPELHARLRVGERMVKLESALAERVKELQSALEHVRQLQGILPICMHCKKIRSDAKTWQRIETYISERTDATFSHGLCGDCFNTHYAPGPEDEP